MSATNTVAEESRFWGISRTTAIVVFAVILLVSLVIIKPAAPKKVVLLTGPEGSAYHELGKRYAKSLGGRGLETEVRVTMGGLDNVKQLASGATDTVAFAPSNIEHAAGDAVDTRHLVSLGSIAWEPIWLFHRSEIEVRRIPDLSGLKVATGGRGSVADFVARELLASNNILDEIDIVPAELQFPEDVSQAFLDGTIDAAFATGAPSSPLISDLLGNERVGPVSFERAEAYEARFPGVARIVVPEGIVDLRINTPDEDLVLLSVTTNLVSLDSLYPGTVPLLLQAVAEADDRRRFTTVDTEFPNGENTSLPLKRSASRYYDHGGQGLAKFLPYSVTRWLNHLGIVVLPLLTVAFLLVKIVPVALKMWSGMQLVQALKELEAVEKAHAAGDDRQGLLADLDAIDRKSAGMFVPRSKVHDYIDVRQFLHDMRERVAGSPPDRES